MKISYCSLAVLCLFLTAPARGATSTPGTDPFKLVMCGIGVVLLIIAAVRHHRRGRE